MKYLSFIIIFSLISSACTRVEYTDPIDRSVTIVGKNNTILGNGVLLGDMTLLTATHVLQGCEGASCKFLHGDNLLAPRDRSPLVKGDLSYVSLTSPLGNPLEISPKQKSGDRILIYRSLSGGIIPVSATVIDTDVSYVGYNTNLATRALSGAMVIDLGLSPGESGTPVWDSDSHLVGIVSATDQEKGISYILRP